MAGPAVNSVGLRLLGREFVYRFPHPVVIADTVHSAAALEATWSGDAVIFLGRHPASIAAVNAFAFTGDELAVIRHFSP